MKSLRIAIYASIILHFLRMTARKLSPAHKIHVDRSKPFYLVFARGVLGGSIPPPPVNIAMCRDYAVASHLLRSLHEAERPGLAFYLFPAPELFPSYSELLKKLLAAPLYDNIARLGVPLSELVHDNLNAAIYHLRKDSDIRHIH